MCKDFDDDACECPDCTEGETVIDCRVITTSSYNKAEEPIIGDLKTLIDIYARLNDLSF